MTTPNRPGGADSRSGLLIRSKQSPRGLQILHAPSGPTYCSLAGHSGWRQQSGRFRSIFCSAGFFSLALLSLMHELRAQSLFRSRRLNQIGGFCSDGQQPFPRCLVGAIMPFHAPHQWRLGALT